MPGIEGEKKNEEPPLRNTDSNKKPAYTADHAETGSGAHTAKLIVVAAVVVTLVLIGWGGYYLYSKNTGEVTQNSMPPVIIKDTAAKPATDAAGKIPDAVSARLKQDSSTATPLLKKDIASGDSYKFIFETTNKKARALKRYDQLKGIAVLKNYNNTVSMDTTDSLSFKIYTIVHCTASDTARVKEQLNAWYYGTKGMKVNIDQ